MTTKEAVDYYGSVRALAQALGVSTQLIYQWGERPPIGRQYELQVKSSGALLADDDARIN